MTFGWDGEGEGRFRLQAWRAGQATVDEQSNDLAALKDRAAGLTAEGCSRVDLSGWNLEVNDWLLLERWKAG